MHYESKETHEGVYAIRVWNEHKTQLTVSSYGAAITSVLFANKAATHSEEMTLFDPETALENRAYFGVTVGRVANRIANGTMKIEGINYSLAKNNGANCLHGGNIGFDKKIWEYRIIPKETEVSVEFSTLSVDGEENFPGNLRVLVTISLDIEDNIKIEYSATTDKTTPVNLTNHTYCEYSFYL